MNQNDVFSASVESFQSHGYVHLPQLFDPPQLACLVQTADQLAAAPESAGKWMKYFERGDNGQRLLNRVECFLDYWPQFGRAMDQSKLSVFLPAVLGTGYQLFKEKLNFKLPGAGGYAPHQDGPAWTMLKGESVTLMIAVDDADEGNGALKVDIDFQCGRHFLPHRGGRIVGDDSISWRAVPIRAGDVIAFSSFLPHCSGGNRSMRSRRAYFITYNAGSDGDRRSEYFRFKREAFPPEVERGSERDVETWRSRLARDLL